MIALEEKERKYDAATHKARLEKILVLWPEIMKIVSQEIPSAESLASLYEKLELPRTLKDIGQDDAMLPTVLRCTKDIRDKYVLSRLAWDLGMEKVLFGYETL